MFKSIHRFFHQHYHTRYHGIYKHAKQLFVFDLALLATGVFMLGTAVFFFLWKPGITDLIELKISLGNDRIKSGDMVSVTVDYTNHSKLTLRHPVLALRLPDGYTIDLDKTPNTNFSQNATFNLADIPPGGKGQAGADGHLWVTPGESQTIIAALTYLPDGASSPEQKLASFIVTLPESVIAASVTAPTSTFPGHTIPFSVNLTNTDAAEHTDLSFVAPGPELRFNPALPAKFSLAAQETKTFTGETTAPNAGDSISIFLTPRIKINNHLINLGTAKKDVVVLSPHLTAVATLGNAPAYLEPGQTLTGHITVKIQSENPFKNIRLRLTPTPGVVDMAATAKAMGGSVVDGSIVFDKTNRTNFADNQSLASDEFPITLILNKTFTFVGDAPAVFELVPTMEGAVAGAAELFTETGSSVRVPLATDLTMQTAAHYYTAEGDQLGRGPLPPTVGQTTKYWVFVQVQNTSNPVTNVSFKAALGPGVTFTGNQSVTAGAQIAYNQGNGEISWNNPEIPASSQTGLYFEVAVTPNPTQIGKPLTLVKDIIFTATDKVVGKNFSLNKPTLTNILPPDDRGVRAGANAR